MWVSYPRAEQNGFLHKVFTFDQFHSGLNCSNFPNPGALPLAFVIGEGVQRDEEIEINPRWRNQTL